MDAPANTLGYMVAGYTVVFVTLLVYLVSLVARFRSLHQDEQTLRELEKKD